MGHVSDFLPQRQTYGLSANVWNLKPTSFLKFKKALTRVRLGSGADAKILSIGNSNVTGYGTSDPNRTTKNAWPAQLARMINSSSSQLPTIEGMTVPQVNGLILDNRVATTGTWDAASTAVGFGWASTGAIKGYWSTVDATATRILTPGITWDKADIYYVRHTGTGTATFTPTGGSAFNLTAGAVTLVNSVVEKATVTAGALNNTNTLTIAKTNATTIFIVGIEFYNSTVTQLRIANAGMASSSAQNWAQNNASYPNVRPGKCIEAYQADLNIISLGSNDANISSRTKAQYLADIQTVVTSAQVNGDVLLMSSFPYGVADPVKKALLDSYAEGLRGLGLPYLDIYNRMGPYAAYNTAGYMFGDGLHGNNNSASEVAGWIREIILNTV